MDESVHRVEGSKVAGGATRSTTSPGQVVQSGRSCHTRYGIFPECPLCGGTLAPEHAHFKCFSCGWRDSCCD